MIIEIEKSFEKAYNKIQNKILAQQILSVIEDVKFANTISEIKAIKKLKGYRNFYRIKTGNYRIGISIKNKVVSFIIFDHRKDIYRKFP
jgi:mRNA interferase RelE/StbE